MQPQKPQVKPVSALLLEAAQYIREHGHVKGSLHETDGRVCVVGAINMVHCGRAYSLCDRAANENNFAARRAMRDFLGLTEDYNLVSWNNALERTADEVIAALEGAACATAR